MIDLRSDTITRPSPEMREAMAHAEVGDDFYADDPTVNALEAKAAELLGKEAALYVPSGTMANELGVRVHTEPGDAILMEARAHLVRSEGGAAAALGGVTVMPLSGQHGTFTADDVRSAVGTPHPFCPSHLSPSPRLVCLENTHNAGGGVVWPLEAIRSVTGAARELGLRAHLDGARLWNAAVAASVPPAQIAEHFDTVSVCFSKGLGAPVGSALVGSSKRIVRARRFRQQFGGAMRQAGIIAAGALYGLNHNVARLADDHRRARSFAEVLQTLPGVVIDMAAVQTNIVRFTVPDMGTGPFVERCFEAGLHLLPTGGEVRAVFHLDVDEDDLEHAIGIVTSVFATADDAVVGHSQTPA